ncbi:MAG: Glycosyltransferase [Nitrospira sp.]|nr:MAG: Glycosyltransferase [Nitrospira sp.]
MADTLITVAMSVHNGAKTVKAAIHSVLWQTYPDWELLVVNDASTDATGRILRQFQDPRIQVIDEQQQKGLAVRLNHCVMQARGRYIARMDADDIAYPDRFERQFRYLESHPEVDVLGHGAVLFTDAGRVLGVYPTACTHEEICRRPWWGFPLAHPTWMGKRLWFTHYRYDDALTKGQDQDVLLRSYRTSRFAALSDPLLGYRIEGISASKSWRGRVNYCRQLARQTHDASSAFTAMRGMLTHSLALGRDVLLETTGSLSQRSRQSFQPANDQVRNQWQEIWRRATSEELLSSELSSALGLES